jgi:tRNA(Ile)-lysidine synthase
VRLAKLEQLALRMSDARFKGATLSGAALVRRGDISDGAEFLIFREPGRSGLPELVLAPGEAAVWDGRFRVALAPEAAAPVSVRALGGKGFSDLRRKLKGRTLLPARAAATLPAFFEGGTLLAVGGLQDCVASDRQAGLCSASFLY